jgi:hypothetical protein
MFNELIPVHNSSCHVMQFKRRKPEKQSATKCHQVYIGFLCMLLQSGVNAQNPLPPARKKRTSMSSPTP